MTVPVWALFCSELPEREAVLRDHLQKRGIKATYWRGFHGLTWGLETCKEFDPGKRITPGHVGLNLGVWAMWQAAYLQGSSDFEAMADDPVIFLEDDAVLPEQFWDRVEEVMEDLVWEYPDWDLVFLGLAECEPGVWHKVTERIGDPNSRLCKLNNPFGTHCMMMRRRAIPILLEHMRAAERNLDQQLWERVLKPGHLKWCAVLPTLVTQRTFDYTHGGRPEWAASTLRETPVLPPPPVLGEDLPGRPSVETQVRTLAMIDPFPCFYRGEPLEEFGVDAAGRSVPLYECARLNLVCHTKRKERIVLDPDRVISCERCTLRHEATRSDKREKLTIPDGHFNPSIAVWNDQFILATRDSWGHSKVALWHLSNDKPDWTGVWHPKPIGSYGSNHPLAPRLEDPRLFKARHPQTGEWHLHAAFNCPDGYPPKIVQVAYVRFATDLSGIVETTVIPSPYGNAYEKNWMPIWDDEAREIRWGYSFKPHHYVMGGNQCWKTDNPFQWTGGVIRGGATPVRVYPHEIDSRDDGLPAVYYHFYHGCLKRERQNVYTVGCNVFEAKPPYRILRQTPVPLLWPDLPAPDETVVKRMVIWPGGAVPHAGAWHLALGIDDTNVRIIRIPFADVEKALDAITVDERDVTTIRDTKIAHGTSGGVL